MGVYFSSPWSKPTHATTTVVDVTSVVIEPNQEANQEAVQTVDKPTVESEPAPESPMVDATDELVIRPDRIIALAGHLGSGKDTLATVLEQAIKAQPELEELPVYRTAFADPIKEIICEQFNISRSYLETSKRSPEPPTGFERPIRELLQHVGDFRDFKSDVWVEALLHKLPKNGVVLITDVRYPNELEALKKRGAYVVLLSRHLDTTTPDTHRSEQSLLPLYKDMQEQAFPTHVDHPLIDVYLKNDHSSTDTLHAVSRRIVQQM